MGCFLACFGFKTNKKRRKSRNISSQNHGSYLPLDSDVLNKLDTTEKHNALDSGIIEKRKEASRSKIKKKVSFNLNVEAYEPTHNHEEDINTLYLSDSEEEEETKWEFNTETTTLMATLHYAQDSISSTIKSYPQNHRYHNCSTDEIYEDEDDDCELEDDLSSDEDKGNDYGSHENYEKNSVFRQNLGLKNEGIEGIGSDLYAKDTRKHVLSVLSPVENLSQWRAVKAKLAPVRCEKENIELEQYEQNRPKCHPKEEQSFDSCDFKNMKNWKVLRDQGCSSTVAVHASLSNWLSLT